MPPRLERPWLRLATFTALAGDGLVRWATLMRPEPGWRLIGLLALAVVMAGAVPVIGRYTAPGGGRRVGGHPPTGLPGLRPALALAQAHEHRAHHRPDRARPPDLLPNTLRPVPWLQRRRAHGDPDGGCGARCSTPPPCWRSPAGRGLGDGRRAAAALPLIALAIVPSTLIRPSCPTCRGCCSSGLLAAFMWGERVRARGRRVRRRQSSRSPEWAARWRRHASTSTRRGWNYRAWAGVAVPVHVDTFNWNQTYGPLRWPQTGHEVFTVTAGRSEG